MDVMEVILAIVCFSIVGYYLADFVKKHRSKLAPVPCPTMVLLGSGGHTTEMLTIIGLLEKCLYSPRIYVMAETDQLSRKKVEILESSRTDYKIETIHRVREVGQGWLSTLLLSVPRALYQSAKLLKFYRPTLIMCNGPGICVPMCIVAKCFRILYGYGSFVVYVESICRVNSLSLTGKILQYLVDKFFIQWPMKGASMNIINFGRIS